MRKKPFNVWHYSSDMPKEYRISFYGGDAYEAIDFVLPVALSKREANKVCAILNAAWAKDH